MCISLEKLKAHSVYLVWLAAMVVFSFLFWFTITPLLFPYTAKMGKEPSRTYIPEFGLIGLFFWITFLVVFWCCFRKLNRGKDGRGETTHLIPHSDDPAFKQGLNDSVKKRLGLLTPNRFIEKSKSGTKQGEVCGNPEGVIERDEVSLQELKVKDLSTPDDGEKHKKWGLISRLSSMRRNKTESDEPAMKIISLPDFSTENSFKLLMPYSGDGCEQCFLSDRNSLPFAANVCKECGKIHSGASDKVRLSWNSRKRKDLNIDLGDEMLPDDHSTSVLSEDAHSPQDVTLEIMETEESNLEKQGESGSMQNKLEDTNDPGVNNGRKGFKKRESLFLLQALHNQNSKSEIFFVVNDFGHLVNEPVELAELYNLLAN